MKLPYYKWFPKDFHSDPNVKRLSALARGCYRDILDLMWMSQYGFKIKVNDRTICAQLGLRPSQWKKVKDELMCESGPVFTVEDGCWVSNRLRAEHTEACQIVAQNSQAGKASGASRRKAAKEEIAKRQGQLFNGEENEDQSSRDEENKEREEQERPVCVHLGKDEQSKALGAYAGLLPTNKFKTAGEMYIVYDDMLDRFKDLYPAVDIDDAIKRAYNWLVINKTKRKTVKGMERFLSNWFEEDQNKNRYGFKNKTNSGQGDTLRRAQERHRRVADKLGFGGGLPDREDAQIDKGEIIEGEIVSD